MAALAAFDMTEHLPGEWAVAAYACRQDCRRHHRCLPVVHCPAVFVVAAIVAAYMSCFSAVTVGIGMLCGLAYKLLFNVLNARAAGVPSPRWRPQPLAAHPQVGSMKEAITLTALGFLSVVIWLALLG